MIQVETIANIYRFSFEHLAPVMPPLAVHDELVPVDILKGKRDSHDVIFRHFALLFAKFAHEDQKEWKSKRHSIFHV